MEKKETECIDDCDICESDSDCPVELNQPGSLEPGHETSTIDIRIIYDMNSDTFSVTGNAKDPKSIVSNFLRTQIGRGVDKNPTNNKTIYTIIINLDLSEDIFSVSHDCGNKGLREGILSRYINK